MVKPAGGDIVFNGKSIARTPPHEHVEQGLVMVPEGRGIFSRLTVEENLLMGAYVRNDKAAIRNNFV